MKCSICGTESKADATKCANCGATLIAPTADQTMLDLRTAVFRRPPIVPAASPAATPAAAPAVAAPPIGAREAPHSNLGGLALVVVALGTIAYFIYLVATTTGAPPHAAVSETPQRSPNPAEQTRPSAPATTVAPSISAAPSPPPVPPIVAEEPKPASPAAETPRSLPPPAPESISPLPH